MPGGARGPTGVGGTAAVGITAEERGAAGATTRLPIRLTVNGRAVALAVEPRRLLVDLLRDDLDLTGTKIGCDTSQCGTCTVHLDGAPVKSCTVLAVQADGSTVRTVEDLAPEPDHLHPLQAAFVEHHGLQCGFCTPGMLMASLALLERTTDPTDDEIREAIHGNYCRCTGYQSIVSSVREAARVMRGDPARSWSDVNLSGPEPKVRIAAKPGA